MKWRSSRFEIYFLYFPFIISYRFSRSQLLQQKRENSKVSRKNTRRSHKGTRGNHTRFVVSLKVVFRPNYLVCPQVFWQLKKEPREALIVDFCWKIGHFACEWHVPFFSRYKSFAHKIAEKVCCSCSLLQLNKSVKNVEDQKLEYPSFFSPWLTCALVRVLN